MFWRWLYYGDGCITETAVLRRRLCYGDGCIMETRPRSSPGVGPNPLLLDSVGSRGASAHRLEPCADTSSRPYFSLCVFFCTGLGTPFHSLCPVIPHCPVPTWPLCPLTYCACLQSCHPARPHPSSEGRLVGPCVLSEHTQVAARSPSAQSSADACLSSTTLLHLPSPASLWVGT